jgi:hypothetical protein
MAHILIDNWPKPNTVELSGLFAFQGGFLGGGTGR